MSPLWPLCMAPVAPVHGPCASPVGPCESPVAPVLSPVRPLCVPCGPCAPPVRLPTPQDYDALWELPGDVPERAMAAFGAVLQGLLRRHSGYQVRYDPRTAQQLQPAPASAGGR